VQVHKGSLGRNQPLGLKIEGHLDREHARSDGLRGRGIRGPSKTGRSALPKGLVPILVHQRRTLLLEESAANASLDARLGLSGLVRDLVENGRRVRGQLASKGAPKAVRSALLQIPAPLLLQ
jgi:hypothetical protein